MRRAGMGRGGSTRSASLNALRKKASNKNEIAVNSTDDFSKSLEQDDFTDTKSFENNITTTSNLNTLSSFKSSQSTSTNISSNTNDGLNNDIISKNLDNLNIQKNENDTQKLVIYNRLLYMGWKRPMFYIQEKPLVSDDVCTYTSQKNMEKISKIIENIKKINSNTENMDVHTHNMNNVYTQNGVIYSQKNDDLNNNRDVNEMFDLNNSNQSHNIYTNNNMLSKQNKKYNFNTQQNNDDIVKMINEANSLMNKMDNTSINFLQFQKNLLFSVFGVSAFPNELHEDVYIHKKSQFFNKNANKFTSQNQQHTLDRNKLKEMEQKEQQQDNTQQQNEPEEPLLFEEEDFEDGDYMMDYANEEFEDLLDKDDENEIF